MKTQTLNKFLLYVTPLILLVYTIPMVYLGMRDGFFSDGGHTLITIWGGIVTIITIYMTYQIIMDLKRFKY